MSTDNLDIPRSLKYKFYEESVQSHESDIDFVNEQFENKRGRKALTLREDFGGTAMLACAWTQQSEKHKAWAIDLDPEPMKYGIENHYAKLSEDQKQRMKYIEGNVLADYEFKTDIAVAFNFSYFIFKKRKELLEYLKKVRASLNEDGMFFMDIFGGEDSRESQVEETEYDDHAYFWDCDKFNPLTSECLYYIHFTDLKTRTKYKKVFTYDWRMWTVMELKELLEEAGFSKVLTFWEEDDEDDEDGEGNGVFYESNDEDNCEAWVSYVVGMV